jgi:hypothetical protein
MAICNSEMTRALLAGFPYGGTRAQPPQTITYDEWQRGHYPKGAMVRVSADLDKEAVIFAPFMDQLREFLDEKCPLVRLPRPYPIHDPDDDMA